MSKYIASVTTWTQHASSHPAERAGKMLAATLLGVGALLLASGAHAADVSQLAIGALSVAAAVTLGIHRQP